MENRDETLQTIKRRQVSLKERIQQWKRQRQSGVLHHLVAEEGGGVDAWQLSKFELKVIGFLCNQMLVLPLDVANLCIQLDCSAQDTRLNELLNRLNSQKLIELSNSSSSSSQTDKTSRLSIYSIDFDNLERFKEKHSLLNRVEHFNSLESKEGQQPASNDEQEDGEKNTVECILSLQSAKEKEIKKTSEEILDLLSRPTAKELSLVEQFRSTGHVQEFCTHGTREECMRRNGAKKPCANLHFLKIIQKHTDESLGDCSFLNTCFHMDSCKYVHYIVEMKHESKLNISEGKRDISENGENGGLFKTGNSNIPLVKTLASATEQPFKRVLFPPQWIRCDLRFFDMSILGKFAVVMADPPWDIHMELPYGTMSDDEMRNLNIPLIQDEGLIFLWVTGRAMELGRECLKLWGYERCDELIWVKTNQLQRLIRTGRTGHWINHGKEHCLVGVKGSPKNINRGLDCDVIVAEVRATSHKPDEIYGIIERLSPGTRKIELFGRQHNTQPNWVTLGNQLDGIHITDPQLGEAYKKRYPEEAALLDADQLALP